MREAQVICCTCATAFDERLKDFTFKRVLIDEATQGLEPIAMLPILKGAKQVVLVGDQCQLGPVVRSQMAIKAGFGRSLFERLLDLGVNHFQLEHQYRMHPCISEFPNKHFYAGHISDGVTAEQRSEKLKISWPKDDCPMAFFNIKGQEIQVDKTYYNAHEVHTVINIICYLRAQGVNENRIGVICTYKAQKFQIYFGLRLISQNGDKYFRSIEVSTVDGFQGREKDYIIVTCTRSNAVGDLGFLKNCKERLNVAITRARFGLIILGNSDLLSTDPVWNKLITYYNKKGILVSSLFRITPPLIILPEEPKKAKKEAKKAMKDPKKEDKKSSRKKK